MARDLRQGGGLLPRQGRLDAYCRSLQRHDGRQWHSGRRRAARLRCRARRQISAATAASASPSSATAPRTRACSSKASISRRCGTCRRSSSSRTTAMRNRPRRDYAVAVDSYVDRAAGFGLPGVTVDGTDFFAVYEAAGEIIKRAREGGGPALARMQDDPLLRPFRGRPADLSRQGRSRGHPRQPGLHQAVREPHPRGRRRQAGRARSDRQGGTSARSRRRRAFAKAAPSPAPPTS